MLQSMGLQRVGHDLATRGGSSPLPLQSFGLCCTQMYNRSVTYCLLTDGLRTLGLTTAATAFAPHSMGWPGRERWSPGAAHFCSETLARLAHVPAAGTEGSRIHVTGPSAGKAGT